MSTPAFTSSLFRRAFAPALLALLVGACSSEVVPPVVDPGTNEPGTPTATHLPPGQQAELEALQAQLATCDGLSTADFLAQHALPQTASLSYDPSSAKNLDLVQGSTLALSADELSVLASKGFVVSDQKRFPTFVYGYESLYALDLPLYVSADSILYAVHRSFDAILAALETHALIGELDGLLSGMRASLAAGGATSLGAQARTDADFYLAVAHSLLTGQLDAPVAGASSSEIDSFVAGATAASGAGSVKLFGVVRNVDFSQFKPRGHYTDTEELSRYFRAMMWLGRVDLRLIETQPDHSQLFNRRQLEGAFALGALMDAATEARWQRIHDTIGGFVGQPDSMTPPELTRLLSDLGLSDPAQLAGLSDDVIAQAIVDGGYGTQKISSHIMINGTGEGTMPLSSSFLVFGQAYVVDSHVFSNVVYDRVGKGTIQRMMPSPLDVAFAALANEQAASMLAPELATFPYAPDLCAMRTLVDAHGDDHWQSSLYNLWLGSLRAISPDPAELADPAAAGLPSLMASEAWGRRVANTQLASWAELRHDTILYAKQSYTGGSSCEFPDAYLDPYPAFYQAVATYAEKGKALVTGLGVSLPAWLPSIPDYFDHLQAAADTLAEMAEYQRSGTPFSAAHMDFINQAVAIQWGCGDPAGADGWYPGLFYDVLKSVEQDPTIADVHTQPTDEVGNEVGRVLHVGTGLPRLMVVTVETCDGPRAYAGLASSYFEKITEDYERLDDESWEKDVVIAHPPDVPWMSDLVVR
jgi:hypothetical protein